MRLLAIAISTVLLAGCSIGENLAFKSTSKIMTRAQPGMQMESDYELAKYAIPASLKTVEGFWVAGPPDSARERLEKILTEGYCQYGTGFVEDDWEAAKFKKDLEAIDYHNTRSTKIFTRCLNYALKTLGKRWQKEIFEGPEVVAKLVKDTGKGKRFPMLMAGMALWNPYIASLSYEAEIASMSDVVPAGSKGASGAVESFPPQPVMRPIRATTARDRIA